MVSSTGTSNCTVVLQRVGSEAALCTRVAHGCLIMRQHVRQPTRRETSHTQQCTNSEGKCRRVRVFILVLFRACKPSSP